MRRHDIIRIRTSQIQASLIKKQLRLCCSLLLFLQFLQTFSNNLLHEQKISFVKAQVYIQKLLIYRSRSFMKNLHTSLNFQKFLYFYFFSIME